MFVDCRIDLPAASLAFVALLVLGIVLITSPSAQAVLLQDGSWFLPAVACLMVGARSAGGRGR